VRFLFPPGVEAELRRFNGRGHRPCHSAPLTLCQPGAKAPGQRPTRPWRALLARQVGRWPALFPDQPVCRAPSRAGGGNAVRFLIPPGDGEGTFTAPMAGAIAPATAPRCPLASRGPKPLVSARPAHGGRFSPARSGAGLSWRLDLPIYKAPSRAGGGNALRFLIPPGGAVSCIAGCPVSLAEAITPATAPRWNQDRPGGPQPPAKRPPRPGPAGPVLCDGDTRP
jgi:hypothetical protein